MCVCVCVCVCAPLGLSWVTGDAEELPFADDHFDVYSVAFGIRNVTHIDQVTQVHIKQCRSVCNGSDCWQVCPVTLLGL